MVSREWSGNLTFERAPERLDMRRSWMLVQVRKSIYTARFRHSSVEECKILRNITWSIVVVNRDAYTRYIYHLTKQGKLKLINWTVIVKPCMIMWDTLYNTLTANHTRIRLQFILLHVPLKITRSSTQNVVKRPYKCSCVAFGKFSLYLLKSE